MKGDPPYLTVEEMRMYKDRFKYDGVFDQGGTRYIGSTEPSLAFKYLPKQGPILECGSSLGAFTRDLQDHGYQHIHALDFTDLLHFPDRNRLTFSMIDLNT